MNSNLRTLLLMIAIISGVYILAWVLTKLVLWSTSQHLAAGGTIMLSTLIMKSMAAASFCTIGLLALLAPGHADALKRRMETRLDRAHAAFAKA